jgi:hypothetical protein
LFRTRDDLVQFLVQIGASTSSTNEEVEKRVEAFKKTHGLSESLETELHKRKRTKVFGRELTYIPESCNEWKVGPYPSFTDEQLTQYASSKLLGKSSMPKKGLNFFKVRKWSQSVCMKLKILCGLEHLHSTLMEIVKDRHMCCSRTNRTLEDTVPVVLESVASALM